MFLAAVMFDLLQGLLDSWTHLGGVSERMVVYRHPSSSWMVYGEERCSASRQDSGMELSIGSLGRVTSPQVTIMSSPSEGRAG